MFDQLVESTAVKTRTNKLWTVILSLVLQSAVVLILVVIPLLFYPQVLSPSFTATKLVAPPAAAPPPPPAAPVRVVRSAPHFVNQGKLQAPTVVPKTVTIVKEAEAPPPVAVAGGTGVFGGVPGGTGDALNGFGNGPAAPAPPPPPPPPPPSPPSAPKPSGPIKVGGQVQAANLLNKVSPVYPTMAKQARISGQVILHAIINKDGSVTQLEVVSGNQILAEAALAAVKQWRYRPTLLNGEPVEVDTTINVLFSLGS